MVLRKDLFLVVEFYVICKCWIYWSFEHFSHSFYDVLAIFSCVDYPAYILLEEFGVSFGFIKASFTVNDEDLLYDSKDI